MQLYTTAFSAFFSFFFFFRWNILNSALDSCVMLNCFMQKCGGNAVAFIWSRTTGVGLQTVFSNG